jgi:DNA-nicking Smr family endonuclease
MPRRRLHGETQKRRQKRSARTLKLRASTVRKRETRHPLPFESSPELDPQDIEFLEAMRDLHVQRLPRQGGAPVRQDAIQRAHFAADSGNDRMFQAAMQHLGVAPIGSSGRPQPQRKPPGASEWEDLDDVDSISGVEERREAPLPPSPSRIVSAPPSRAHFDESEDGAKLMEEALRSGVAGLNEKFQGAPSRPRKRKVVERSDSETEPDDELDLHGKTQEEAIRMLQHFLLSAKAKRLRTVLVITGKGLNSGGQGPVLRGAVQTWLERHGAPYLRRFSWAPPRLGGDGAIWVELW